jgi:penicillin-binding protein 1A
MLAFIRSLIRGIFWFVIGGITLGGVGAAAFLVWGYFYITRDLPRLENVQDYNPPAVTKIFDSENNQIAEFYLERRYPVSINGVPEQVKYAFIAAEDASFYSHPGIDVVSIARAVIKNFQAGSKKQGASTITQQVVKKIFLTPEKDYRRKIKEAILSYRLEKQLTKDEILGIYLNQMYFGNGAYGINAAAQIYFHKQLTEITIAEAAMLAGLLKAPSKYSPVQHFDKAKNRQNYVLQQMERGGFISKEDRIAAEQEKIVVYPVNNTRIQRSQYYASEVRRELANILGSEREVDTGGYTVYTALDSKAEEFAVRALRKNLKEVDKRRGWRGVSDFVEPSQREAYIEKLRKNFSQRINGQIIPALALNINRMRDTVELHLGEGKYTLGLRSAPWMKQKITSDNKVIVAYPEAEIIPGSVVEVSWNLGEPDPPRDDKLEFDQTPEIEGAIVLLDPYSGKVAATVGGYDYNRSQFNRATQSYRQPGSSFKPILYLTAVDAFGYTPTSIVYDQPRAFRVGDEVWTPANFDEKFLGGITLRNALEKSRNLVSADIISKIGIDAVIAYARKMGINSDLGRNLSLALGSSEVTMLELVRAYGVLAAKGILVDSVFVTKIIDRHGKVIFDYKDNLLKSGKQVVDENSAFILSYMMKGVIDYGTGVKIKPLKRPVAGKTGTSNDQMDAWFIGYTPEWVCGVWLGFDLKKEIGSKETGGKIAAPVWLDFMKPFLEYRDSKSTEKMQLENQSESLRLGIEPEEVAAPQPLDFTVPAGVDPYWVDKSSGLRSCQDCPGAILEYFKKGSAPTRGTDMKEDAQSYLEAGDL